MRIDHYQEPCTGAKPGFCLRVLESSDPAIADADQIAGFEHRWGYVSEVVVLVSESGDEEIDLVEVLSQTRVEDDERFEIVLSPDFIDRVENREFQLVSDAIAYCLDPAVCHSVGRALVEGRAFAVELSHNPADSGTFIAHGVTDLE